MVNKVSAFIEWLNSSSHTDDIKNKSVEELVLDWADATETDLGDSLNEFCEQIVELGIC